MALFPIYGRFAGDFVAHLVAADTDDTMDEVAEKVAVHSVGRRIQRPAVASGYDVLLDGETVPAATTLGELGLVPLQWLDVRFRA
jgi:Toluene-4-monooxygenase system protein B (TmoB)